MLYEVLCCVKYELLMATKMKLLSKYKVLIICKETAVSASIGSKNECLVYQQN